MILSLQGCMAAGKTTALRYLQARRPDIPIFYEDNAAVIAQVKGLGLDKNVYADYLQIQRLWIENEIQRWEQAKQHPVAVMDFGAEEIAFYTLNYPKSISADWDVARDLASELARLEVCMPDRILFLNASEETLRRNKTGDATRSRNFFDHYLTHILPLKREWFLNRSDVDVLNVDGLTARELGDAVTAWVEQEEEHGKRTDA